MMENNDIDSEVLNKNESCIAKINTENKNQSRHIFEKKHVASFRNMLKECEFMDTGDIFTQ